MAAPQSASSFPEELPLISNRFLGKLTAIVAVLALLTVGISVGGRWFGQRISLAGQTDSTEIHSIVIGQDRLNLSANTIRFSRQRAAGAAERVDLYLTWPEMDGYTGANRQRFDDIARSNSLLFLQMSQSTMSRDMSGRLQPIYSHLFAGAPEKSAYGLTLHRLKPEAGYGDEVVLTAVRPGKPDYVVRCLMPATPQEATSGDCQRDIHIGKDLSVLYRFSSTVLSDWDHIDADIQSFVQKRLQASL